MAQLPFPYPCELRALDGTVLGTFFAAVWPARSSRSGDSGEVFDHTGEAPVAQAAALVEQNRTLAVLSGPMAGEYRVVTATPQPFMPSCDLELVRVRSGG
jgi:hypothetical protein